jgi:acyl-CoA synthetase (AMP-forming)/AMP-acid ligase II
VPSDGGFKCQVLGSIILTKIQQYVANNFGSLPDMVREHAKLRPEHIAVRHRDREISYADFDQAMDRFAAALQRDGHKPGDCVSICSLSSIEYVIGFLGTLRAGMTVVPLAPSSTPKALMRMIEDCGASLLFIDAASFDELEALLGDAQTSIAGLKVVRLDLQTEFEAFLAEDPQSFEAVEISPEWNFNIIYSSGTTGTPKGIVQSHRMRWPMMVPGDPMGYGPDAVTIASTPLYSNTTLTSFIPTLSGGGTIILMEKFNVLGFLELSEKWRATHAMLVPVQYRRIMESPEFENFDLSSFVLKFCTSAPFSAELKADILKRWPGGLIEYYGMTEGGGSCMLVAHEFPDKLATVGRPLPEHEMFVIDEAGNPCPAGQTGEIVGTSKAIMRGYNNQPEKTAETEWFAKDGRRFIRTGDVGRFDEDGFLTLMDRKKDMIISGGFNIYPSDLEAVLALHPDVKDMAVVGVASDQWGETPIAFVVLSEAASIAADELKQWCNAQLGKTQRLADLVIVSELPRSAIGKILKRELRELYSA